MTSKSVSWQGFQKLQIPNIYSIHYLRRSEIQAITIFLCVVIGTDSHLQQVFHLPLILVPIHLAVAIAVHSICLIAIAGLERLLPSRFLSGLLIGFYGFFVCFFYVLIFGSVHFWGDIVTLKILGTYFKDFGDFLQSLLLPSHYTL